ncbi:hypothetical protein DC20_15975 [Rufibacter tibetensis]|uniref:InsA N-terminal domain-containing protein n=1 Tax=Rufibacter tibetensis TaxID=512763 RepID=A0A0P0CEC9_9BACT|nr:hypothetical protein DC20_15975 [Rufibacter tibetensis]
MFEVFIKVNCPHCQSSKIVKNGRKGTARRTCYAIPVESSFRPLAGTKVLTRPQSSSSPVGIEGISAARPASVSEGPYHWTNKQINKKANEDWP